MVDFSCYELGTCKFPQDPFGTMLLPFNSIFGDLALVIFWALIIGVIWIRTQNPQMVSIIGIVLTAGYLGAVGGYQNLTLDFIRAHTVGAVLIVLSLAIGIWHILIRRITSGAE